MRPFGRAKFVRSVHIKMALQAAILVAALTATAHADDVEGKLSYCKDCHGVSAQGYRGYFPIPRLAGQQPEYLENQLHAFIEHRRTNNIMFNVAHALNPAMVSALGAHFRSLNPPPIDGAPTGLRRRDAKSFKTAYPTPISRLAPHAMARTPQEKVKFRDWPGSSIPT